MDVNRKISIVIADDDNDIIDLLTYNLQKENYVVYSASNGKIAIQQIEKHLPDLVLLDVMMPEINGIEVCQIIKENDALKNIPVLFLTARHEEYSELAGFAAGADDYIIKPIKPKLLLSRIKAVLSRTKNITTEEDIITFGNLKINKSAYQVMFDGELINFPKKEFEILCLLSAKPGRVYTREQIMDKLWDKDVIVGDRTIDVHVRKIREKLNNKFIYTIKGVGYKFEP